MESVDLNAPADHNHSLLDTLDRSNYSKNPLYNSSDSTSKNSFINLIKKTAANVRGNAHADKDTVLTEKQRSKVVDSDGNDQPAVSFITTTSRKQSELDIDLSDIRDSLLPGERNKMYNE